MIAWCRLKILFCLIGILVTISSSFAFKRNPSKLYKKVFKDYTSSKSFTVKDTISEDPVNTKILKALDSKGKTIGYIREVATTTGCNSACLPILVTLFYDKDKKFLTLKSRQGLTKKNHVPFTELDYQRLELILVQNPKVFTKVNHPKLMVDAITSETLKEYQASVVKEAAYTSLRLNLYNQDTLKLLKGLELPSSSGGEAAVSH